MFPYNLNSYSFFFRKRAAKQLIERYYYQITEGCGQSDCNNEHCASSSSFTKKDLTRNEAGLQAIELFKNKAKLCDSRPSKVARSQNETGDAASASSSASAATATPSSAGATTSSILAPPSPAASTSATSSSSSALPTASSSSSAHSMDVTAFTSTLHQQPDPARASTSAISPAEFSQVVASITAPSPSRSRNSVVKSITQAVAAGES